MCQIGVRDQRNVSGRSVTAEISLKREAHPEDRREREAVWVGDPLFMGLRSIQQAARGRSGNSLGISGISDINYADRKTSKLWGAKDGILPFNTV